MGEELVTLTKVEEGALLGVEAAKQAKKHLEKLQGAWEREMELVTSRATSRRYGFALDAFLSYFPEKSMATEFTRKDILEYKARRRKNRISARTVNYEIGVVRRFFNWLIAREEAFLNPTIETDPNTGKQHTPLLRELKPAKVSLSEEAQERLYGACLDDKERLLVGLGLTTGLRPNTLAQLEKSDFNVEQGQLVIGPEKMKTGRSLELPIRSKEMALIQALPDGLIFGKWGRDADALSYRWNKVCARIEIPLRGMRTARRTVASTFIRRGVPLPMVQQWLGHKDIRTTMEYVTPATSSEMRDILKILPTGAA